MPASMLPSAAFTRGAVASFWFILEALNAERKASKLSRGCVGAEIQFWELDLLCGNCCVKVICVLLLR